MKKLKFPPPGWQMPPTVHSLQTHSWPFKKSAFCKGVKSSTDSANKGVTQIIVLQLQQLNDLKDEMKEVVRSNKMIINFSYLPTKPSLALVSEGNILYLAWSMCMP